MEFTELKYCDTEQVKRDTQRAKAFFPVCLLNTLFWGQQMAQAHSLL